MNKLLKFLLDVKSPEEQAEIDAMLMADPVYRRRCAEYEARREILNSLEGIWMFVKVCLVMGAIMGLVGLSAIIDSMISS